MEVTIRFKIPDIYSTDTESTENVILEQLVHSGCDFFGLSDIWSVDVEIEEE